MELFLFWESHPAVTGRIIRPVPYRDPSQWTSPMVLPETPDAVAWLNQYGDPVFEPYHGQKACAIMLGDRLGFWPPPFIADIRLMKDVPLNDPIPF